MSWLSQAVTNIGNGISSFVNDPLRTTKENPEVALLATAAVAVATGYVDPSLALGAAESGTATTATAAAGAEALSPVVAADVGSWGTVAAVEAGTGTAATTAASAWTAKDILAGANTGLTALSTGAKLSLLGKSMDAQTATANGLTGALAASPIQTPSGLITTTPQGPVMTGTQAASGGFMGMDNQTLFVIAVGIAAVYYFSKHGK